jgi:hypothetical protein
MTINILSSGNAFGHRSMFGPRSSEGKCTATVRAVTFCELEVLGHEEVNGL